VPRGDEDVEVFFLSSSFSFSRRSLSCSLSLHLDLDPDDLFQLFFLFFLPSSALCSPASLSLSFFSKNLSQEFKGSDFGWHKTKIAQMLTIKRERELAEGVSKRDSRAAAKRAKVDAGFGQF
jgi:hypothetical protein